MARPPTRAALSRVTIVAAARDLVVASGLEALSLRRLAGDLGVTAPALYAHVTGKGDLLRALATAEFEALVARFDAVGSDDPLERIRAHGRAYVAHARERPELFRVMFVFPPDLGASAPPGAELPPDGAELPAATRAFATAAAAVDAAVASGAIEAPDPLLVSLALWSSVHGVATVLQLGPELPAEVEESLVDEVVDRLLRGYAPGRKRS